MLRVGGGGFVTTKPGAAGMGTGWNSYLIVLSGGSRRWQRGPLHVAFPLDVPKQETASQRLWLSPRPPLLIRLHMKLRAALASLRQTVGGALLKCQIQTNLSRQRAVCACSHLGSAAGYKGTYQSLSVIIFKLSELRACQCVCVCVLAGRGPEALSPPLSIYSSSNSPSALVAQPI